MRIVGVIPARWGSSRFPGKSLTLLCGKPLVCRVWERARQAATLDALVVATDDERIRRAIADCGGAAVMTGANHPSGADRVAEAARGMAADLVVNIQGDEPLIDPALIDLLVETAQRAAWDMVTAAAAMCPPADMAAIQSPSVCKVVCDAGGRALYFSRHPIPFVRDAGFKSAQPLYLRHIGIYLYRRDFLERMVREPPSLLERAESLEQLRALHIGGAIGVVKTAYTGVGVDTPEDVPAAEAALRQAGLDGGMPCGR